MNHIGNHIGNHNHVGNHVRSNHIGNNHSPSVYEGRRTVGNHERSTDSKPTPPPKPPIPPKPPSVSAQIHSQPSSKKNSSSDAPLSYIGLSSPSTNSTPHRTAASTPESLSPS